MTDRSSIDDVARVLYEHLSKQIPAARPWGELPNSSQTKTQYRSVAQELVGQFDIRSKAATA